MDTLCRPAGTVECLHGSHCRRATGGGEQPAATALTYAAVAGR
jgi:hypothetical protein